MSRTQGRSASCFATPLIKTALTWGSTIARAKGVGSTTGATYALNYTEGGSVSTSFPPPYSFTVVSHQNFLSHGNVPDFMLHATLSITVDDTGNFFATVIDSRTECR